MNLSDFLKKQNNKIATDDFSTSGIQLPSAFNQYISEYPYHRQNLSIDKNGNLIIRQGDYIYTINNPLVTSVNVEAPFESMFYHGQRINTAMPSSKIEVKITGDFLTQQVEAEITDIWSDVFD